MKRPELSELQQCRATVNGSPAHWEDGVVIWPQAIGHFDFDPVHHGPGVWQEDDRGYLWTIDGKAIHFDTMADFREIVAGCTAKECREIIDSTEPHEKAIIALYQNRLHQLEEREKEVEHWEEALEA